MSENTVSIELPRSDHPVCVSIRVSSDYSLVHENQGTVVGIIPMQVVLGCLKLAKHGCVSERRRE